jgi:hypothetical protein
LELESNSKLSTIKSILIFAIIGILIIFYGFMIGFNVLYNQESIISYIQTYGVGDFMGGQIVYLIPVVVAYFIIRKLRK